MMFGRVVEELDETLVGHNVHIALVVAKLSGLASVVRRVGDRCAPNQVLKHLMPMWQLLLNCPDQSSDF